MSLYKETLEAIKTKRKKILDGGVNCIPSPFKRFQNDFCGIEQDTYYCITSFTKGGKSQLTSFMFIYNTILYAYFAKEKVDFKIIYFPLEETKERIVQRFMSWLLFRKSSGNTRVCPRELRSTTGAVDEEIINKLENFDIEDLVDYFEDHVIFPEESPNPTGIYNWCKQYAEDHGTVKTKITKYKDELGEIKEKESFGSYEQDNPDEFRMVIIDTVNLINTERNLTLKQSIDKLSEYCAKYLRNRYHYSPIFIQQQAFESEGNEAIKLGKVRPSVAGLGDSKYVSRDADVVLGLFSPMRFGLKEYLGYDVTKLKDHLRFLEVIVNRNGEMGGIIPLWFDGAVCEFKELPPASDKSAMDSIYNYCKSLRPTLPAKPAQPADKKVLFMPFTERIKHIININKF